jgi:mannose-6-phosphate isomerase
MPRQSLYPLRFEPIFQYRLWGGTRLEEWLGTPRSGNEPVGEAWVLSDRPDLASKVADGPVKGATITELMASSGDLILGDLFSRFARFPLLLKFLDVRLMLSVQVHPQDDRADLIPKGDTGKTEAWVVLEADPESRIYAGLKPGTTEADLRALTTQTADDHLASFTPKCGQGVMIEAGTVHSLGDGVMVFEVQQNSDTTFRLYDWDHIDAKSGRPRDLQIDRALACIDLAQGPIRPVEPAVELNAPVLRECLFNNSHFRLWRLRGDVPFAVGASGVPRILVGIDGEGDVEFDGKDYPVPKGGVMLLPASIGICLYRPRGGVTLLEIAVPEGA